MSSHFCPRPDVQVTVREATTIMVNELSVVIACNQCGGLKASYAFPGETDQVERVHEAFKLMFRCLCPIPHKG